MRKKLALSFDQEPIKKLVSNRKLPLPANGARFGKLTVTGRLGFVTSGIKRLMISCRCDCGTETFPYVQTLTAGKAVSCGCAVGGEAEREGIPKIERPLYATWCNMRRRCLSPCSSSYQWYGARGIRICDEWRDDYWAFDDWAMANGWAPGLSIDRIDFNGDYEPSNCRWATSEEQARNKSVNFIVKAFGESRVLMDWISDPRCVVPFNVARWRLHHGFAPERALTEPAFSGKLYSAFGESKLLSEWVKDPRCVVAINTLQERVKPHRHMTFEEALTKPPANRPVANRVAARAKRRVKEALKRQQRQAAQLAAGGPPNSAT